MAADGTLLVPGPLEPGASCILPLALGLTGTGGWQTWTTSPRQSRRDHSHHRQPRAEQSPGRCPQPHGFILPFSPR